MTQHEGTVTPRSLSLSVTVSVTLHSLSFPISGSVSNSSALVKAGVSCQLKFLEGEGDRDKVVRDSRRGRKEGSVSNVVNVSKMHRQVDERLKLGIDFLYR